MSSLLTCPVTSKHIRVALVGQPNVGKSMLVNSISSAKLHVGNFSGVTVEKCEVLFNYKDYHFTVVDLPGTYALSSYSIEERVTTTFLREEEYDIILNVLNSTELEKNLRLTFELMTLDKKMVLALNMSDEAEKEGIEIDSNYLSQLLAIKSTLVSAATKSGIDELLDMVIETHESKTVEPKIIFSEAVDEEVDRVTSYLDLKGYSGSMSNKNVAIKLLQEDIALYKSIHDTPIYRDLQPLLREADEHIKTHHDSDDLREIWAEEAGAFSRGVVAETVKFSSSKNRKLDLSERIDSVLIHPLFGIPIFLFFMWSLFQLTFEIGNIPMEWIDGFFGWLGDSIGDTIAHDGLRSLIVDGLIAGVGAVVLFVPNIVILFLGIALLESTGYMSRVAFLLDGIFHKFGLHGQSFIPLVTGFGCSIPAYMSARILKNDRDRLLTLFVIGFMSCGAKLPVYVLFTGAFFEPNIAGNILFAIYMFGAMLGLIAAKILKIVVFKGEDEPFIMEMPRYRLPSLKLISHTVISKVWMYLKKAGTFIALASMLVWFLSNYPKSYELQTLYEEKISQTQDQHEIQTLENLLAQQELEQSYLGRIGKGIEPLFEPIGLDWKLAVALQAGLAAKEVVVSTLGVLYAVGESDESGSSLKDAIRENITFAQAVSFIVIIMIYLPCLAASIVFTREAGGVRYFFYLFIFTTITAYSLAFIAYHATVALT